MAIGGVYEFRRRIHPFGSRETTPAKPAVVNRPAVAKSIRGLFSRLSQKGDRR